METRFEEKQFLENVCDIFHLQMCAKNQYNNNKESHSEKYLHEKEPQ
jgi:hypothetical protein